MTKVPTPGPRHVIIIVIEVVVVELQSLQSCHVVPVLMPDVGVVVQVGSEVVIRVLQVAVALGPRGTVQVALAVVHVGQTRACS